ncbi:hypothetical protein CFOL_v3_10678 [Cephalotus follicularis]|uniref:Uncharacterized protein n=1 Tax=Cephalotus follicularis TaxID=3775 RepID=A0A1Q3BGZ1_CEPFO|nr:hypothetical protein CFOL_v3_10678 [Cephalotus follicularis]
MTVKEISYSEENFELSHTFLFLHVLLLQFLSNQKKASLKTTNQKREREKEITCVPLRSRESLSSSPPPHVSASTAQKRSDSDFDSSSPNSCQLSRLHKRVSQLDPSQSPTRHAPTRHSDPSPPSPTYLPHVQRSSAIDPANLRGTSPAPARKACPRTEST